MSAFERAYLAFRGWLRFRVEPRSPQLVLPVVLGIVFGPFVLAATLSAALGLRGAWNAVVIALGFAPQLVALAAVRASRRLTRRVEEAYARDDYEEIARVRRAIEGEGPPRSPFEAANRLIGEAELLRHFERWEEAREVFARIDREALPAENRPGILGQLGLATAHAGQPALGITFLQRALREADAVAGYPAEKRWYLRARLAVARSLASQDKASLTDLLELLKEDAGDLRIWTELNVRAADCCRALGDVGNETALLELALEGEGPYVARARERLDRNDVPSGDRPKV